MNSYFSFDEAIRVLVFSFSFHANIVSLNFRKPKGLGNGGKNRLVFFCHNVSLRLQKIYMHPYD